MVQPLFLYLLFFAFDFQLQEPYGACSQGAPPGVFENVPTVVTVGLVMLRPARNVVAAPASPGICTVELNN
jgi:hypothetical protein